jgi:hypothetical protein
VDQVLRILTGHTDTFKVRDYFVQVPKRIAFSHLGQDEWDEYLSRAKDVVVRELLPGVELQEVEDEIARMVA